LLQWEAVRGAETYSDQVSMSEGGRESFDILSSRKTIEVRSSTGRRGEPVDGTRVSKDAEVESIPNIVGNHYSRLMGPFFYRNLA